MSKLQEFIANFPWVKNDNTPFARLGKELSQCTVALISTGGVYAPPDTSFAITNRDDVDESYREIPLSVPLQSLGIAHEHFDKRHCQEDLNVVFPVERMKELAQEGFIGSVAETNYSITGYVPRPENLFETGKQIASSLKSTGVDAVIMVPVWPICQQSGGLVVREIEAVGIPTVTLNLIPEIVSIVGIPRVLNVLNPFGSPVGAPNNVAQQLTILRQALQLLEQADAPLAMVRSEERYQPVPKQPVERKWGNCPGLSR